MAKAMVKKMAIKNKPQRGDRNVLGSNKYFFRCVMARIEASEV
jgi:hypothetical protein